MQDHVYTVRIASYSDTHKHTAQQRLLLLGEFHTHNDDDNQNDHCNDSSDGRDHADQPTRASLQTTTVVNSLAPAQCFKEWLNLVDGGGEKGYGRCDGKMDRCVGGEWGYGRCDGVGRWTGAGGWGEGGRAGRWGRCVGGERRVGQVGVKGYLQFYSFLQLLIPFIDFIICILNVSLNVV